MTYIIKPGIVYLINVLSSLGIFMSILSIFSVIASVILVGMYASWKACEYMQEEFAIVKSLLRIVLPIAIISTIVAIVVPSRETMLYMLLADIVTVDNVEVTIDTLKETVAYIAEMFSKFS